MPPSVVVPALIWQPALMRLLFWIYMLPCTIMYGYIGLGALRQEVAIGRHDTTRLLLVQYHSSSSGVDAAHYLSSSSWPRLLLRWSAPTLVGYLVPILDDNHSHNNNNNQNTATRTVRHDDNHDYNHYQVVGISYMGLHQQTALTTTTTTTTTSTTTRPIRPWLSSGQPTALDLADAFRSVDRLLSTRSPAPSLLPMTIRHRQDSSLPRGSGSNKSSKQGQRRWCLEQDSAVLACHDQLLGIYSSASKGDDSTLTMSSSSSSSFKTQWGIVTASYQLPGVGSWWGLDAILSQVRLPSQSPLRQVWSNPGTTLWIGIMVILAFLYWTKHVAPTEVGKLYSRMAGAPHEAWRALTGPTAHFDLWHLTLNMMSLWTFGHHLEGPVITSLEFVLAQPSLMVLTTIVWALMQYCAHHCGSRWRSTTSSSNMIAGRTQVNQLATTAAAAVPHHLLSDDDDMNTPTVGFSGVLFVWIVVVALSEESTCPVPFLPTLCFRTTHMPWTRGFLKWSWTPWVQLVLAQVLLPRVSWTGHLAGILIGFALMAGDRLRPILHWAQPAILLPLCHLLYLALVVRIVPWRPLSTVLWVSTPGGHGRVWIRLSLVLLMCSIQVLGPVNVMTVTFFISVLWMGVYLTGFSVVDTNPHNRELVAPRTLARGCVVCIVLVSASNAMTIGSWFAFGWVPGWALTVLLSENGMLLAALFLVVRQSLWLPGTTDEGIFHYTVDLPIVQPTRALITWCGGTMQHRLNHDSSNIDDFHYSGVVVHWTRRFGVGRRLGVVTEETNRSAHGPVSALV